MESLCTGVSHTTSTTQSTTTTQTKSQSASETEGTQNSVGVNVMLGGGVSREISEVKQVDTKSQEGYLDSSVRKSFERLQEGKNARAESRGTHI